MVNGILQLTLYNQIICVSKHIHTPSVFTIIFGIKMAHNCINYVSLMIIIITLIYIKKATTYLPTVETLLPSNLSSHAPL